MSGRRSLFGTDGVRGLANAEPMSVETVLRLGRAIALRAVALRGRRDAIVVGRDTRRSGAMLEAALAGGITSAGVNVLLAGELPTPGIAFLTRRGRAAAGAVISASHNPFADNGVKFFGPDGFKLANDEESAIEALTDVGGDLNLPTGAEVGTIKNVVGARQSYERFLLRAIPQDLRLDGLKVAIDCANGAAHRVGPQLFERLRAHVTAIGTSPDGTNINERCGAMHPDSLQEVVRKTGADIGIALDGDADRALFVDAHGDLVDGDEILAIMAFDLLRRNRLRRNLVVGTVMSNMGLEVALRGHRIELIRAAVGDRYVVDEMRKHGANLGGEPSGHTVLFDHHTTGDGLLAALEIVRIMRETGKVLATLRRAMGRFPQVLKNVRVARRRPLEELPAVQATLHRVAAELAGRGRVLVRFSGTEPLVRVMVEGDDVDRVESLAQEVANVVAKELNGADRLAVS